MKYGGSETFAIREGWLHKGLKLLRTSPALLGDPYVADWLGVGRNMGKSIKHWLLATGLATVSSGPDKHPQFVSTQLGDLVASRDPYFVQHGTWWALHIELVNCPDHAAVWWWFFNHFSLTRFDRAMCLSALQTHLQLTQQRPPAQKTLQRDIACLIATYATYLPAEANDPEDADDCPFRELRLMTYSRATGACTLDASAKEIPAELLGYSLAKSLGARAEKSRMLDVTLREASNHIGGPGKAFVMGPDALFELALKSEQVLGRSNLEVAGLGAERMIRIVSRSRYEWLDAYYDRIEAQRHAA
jgi:hypothetical protein